jgi:hypothetical protein
MRLQAQNTVRVNQATRTGLSITPAATGDAALQVQEHAPFLINLNAGGTEAPNEWVVDWGDGQVQTYPGNAPDAVHAYSDGANTYQIVAKAVDIEGEDRIEHVSNTLTVTTSLR